MIKTRASRQRIKNGVPSNNKNNIEVDRICSLPDEVLTHILSFLSTKLAVQTCVLSKRWKNTWASVPILEIQQKDFLLFRDDDDCRGDCNEAIRMSAARFERFMTGVLDNRAPTNLDRVCCVRHIHSFEPDTSIGWLNRVVLLMPQKIFIVIANFTGNSIDVPNLVFSCASLYHLSMSLYAKVETIIRPISINLPSLKFLELNGVELHDDFAEKLFMGCPSLERLTLCHCELYFSSISSEVLKALTLDSCDLYEEMQISCSNLVSLFTMINLKGVGISLKNLSSLVNAVIKLYGYFSDDVPVLNLFGGLSNVTNLELRLDIPKLQEQLVKYIPNGKNFNNLKKLGVAGKWDISYDFYLISCFLMHSPNLKELELLLDESRVQIQEPQGEVSGAGAVLFQHEYLETVKISPVYRRKLSSELINAMINTLGRYVKKIGNLIIT